MNKEAKIGLIFVIFFVAFMLLGVWIKGNPFKRDYYIKVLFPNVHGLHKGSLVEYEGLNCGTVVDFEIHPKGIVAVARITEPEIKLYESDRFLIVPNSTIASEFEIIIKKGDFQSQLIDLSQVQIGEVPPGLDDFLFTAKDAIKNLNALIGDVRVLVQETHGQISDLTPAIEKASNIIQSGQIEKIIDEVESSTTNLNQTILKANTILSSKEKQVNTIISNSEELVEQLNHKIALVSDDDISDSVVLLKSNLNNLNSITSSINPKDLETIQQAASQASIILESLQSDDPSKDVPTLLRENIQRIDRISSGLEKNLENYSLLKALLHKVPISKESN